MSRGNDGYVILSHMIDYKTALNEEQYAVIEGGDGPTLVLAGAGSGKTRTIIYRVAWLLEQGIDSGEILLVTFTNKAAREMTSRLESLLGSHPSGMWSGTFHSIANRVLRLHAHRLGYEPNFTILDQDDSVSLVKACIKEEKISTAKRRFPSPRVIQGMLSYMRNANLGLEEVVEQRNSSFAEFVPELARIAELYAQKKRDSNAMDFDDLLLNLHDLLVEHPEVESRLSTQFRYILVDEYQDTNTLQANIVTRLSQKHRNVLVVGDDAQSIYSFRAADIRNILNFPNLFENCKTFRLESNYRSTPQILELANASISKNTEQFPKELHPMNEGQVKPSLVHARSGSEEARYIMREIELQLQRGVRPDDIAVLFRAAYQSQSLEFELMKSGIAYDYRGGLRFFARAHVKDVLAFLRVAENPKDEAAWIRILSIQVGVGLVTAQKIIAAARVLPLDAILDESFMTSVPRRGQDGFRVAREILSRIDEKDLISEKVKIVSRSSYIDYLEFEYTNAPDRLDDIEQLVLFAEEYGEDLQTFLEEVTLRDEFGATVEGGAQITDRIILSTIHQSKGLEWDTVFVMSLADGHFPNKRALYENDGLEEERRLFYVAVTRAKNNLHLTYSTMGSGKHGELCVPSMFVEELPPGSFDVVGGGAARSGLMRGGYNAPSTTVFRPAHLGDPADQGYHEDEAIVIGDDGEPQTKVSSSFLRDVF